MIKRISVASLAMLGFFTGAAYADGDGGRYTGVSFNQTKVSIDDADFSESGTGYKLFGGYMFNKNFGLELGYQDGANAEKSVTAASLKISPSAFTIEGIGRIPLGQNVAIFGKAGAAFYDAQVEARALGLSSSSSESGTEFIYGVGVSIGLGDKFEIRAEWETFDFSIDDVTGAVNMISLGGAFKF